MIPAPTTTTFIIPSPRTRTLAGMGVLGEMFPGRKIADESTEAGDGQEHFQLGPIDLDNRTVQVQRVVTDEPEQDPT
jgi:hypothetical protein